MKKAIIITLFFAFTLTLSACSFSTTEPDSLTFYYIKSKDNFDGISDIIVPFYPNTSITNDSYAELLGLYFNGPTNYSCYSPFPAGTTLEELNVTRSKAKLTLSPHFATISDVELTIACACLTKTVIGITGVNSVQILVNGAQLCGEDSLTFNLNSFTYYDELPANQDN